MITEADVDASRERLLARRAELKASQSARIAAAGLPAEGVEGTKLSLGMVAGSLADAMAMYGKGLQYLGLDGGSLQAAQKLFLSLLIESFTVARDEIDNIETSAQGKRS